MGGVCAFKCTVPALCDNDMVPYNNIHVASMGKSMMDGDM